MSFELQPADPGARRQALIWLVAIFLCGLLLLLFAEPLVARVVDWASSADGDRPLRMLAVVGFAGSLTALPALLVAVWLQRTAAAVRLAERFPPPHFRVYRDTRVLHGDKARSRARLLGWLALALFICAVLVVWFLFRIWQLLIP